MTAAKQRAGIERTASANLAEHLAQQGVTHKQLCDVLRELGHRMDPTSIGRLISGARGWGLDDYAAINTALNVDLLDGSVLHVGPCMPLHQLAHRLSDLTQEVRDLSGDVEAALSAQMPDAPSPSAALNLTPERTSLLGWATDGVTS